MLLNLGSIYFMLFFPLFLFFSFSFSFSIIGSPQLMTSCLLIIHIYSGQKTGALQPMKNSLLLIMITQPPPHMATWLQVWHLATSHLYDRSWRCIVMWPRFTMFFACKKYPFKNICTYNCSVHLMAIAKKDHKIISSHVDTSTHNPSNLRPDFSTSKMPSKQTDIIYTYTLNETVIWIINSLWFFYKTHQYLP